VILPIITPAPADSGPERVLEFLKRIKEMNRFIGACAVGILVISSVGRVMTGTEKEKNTVSDEVRKAVTAGGKAFVKYFGNRDAAAITSIYTPHAKLLPPNEPNISGTAAMQKFWSAHPDLGSKTLKVETVELEQHGDTAIEVGQYSVGKGLDNGKYMIIWKRVDGIWKMHRDMWNSSLPAPK